FGQSTQPGKGGRGVMIMMSPDDLPRRDGEVDNTIDIPGKRAPLVLGNKNFADVTDTVTSITLHKTPRAWYVAFVLALGLLGLLFVTIGYLVTTGVGVWGNNQPVSWAFDIVNFVFWVGIG